RGTQGRESRQLRYLDHQSATLRRDLAGRGGYKAARHLRCASGSGRLGSEPAQVHGHFPDG
nr:hypothetical protein [Tanacetum cinerariifolium]